MRTGSNYSAIVVSRETDRPSLPPTHAIPLLTMQGAAQRPFVTQNHPILNHADLPFKSRPQTITGIVVATINGKSRKPRDATLTIEPVNFQSSA
jgi:hypothetical protein